tara:strand:- start:1637 stop:3022 length:1386 start_codon:yes stop_codon:yes gene_type:complete
VSFFRRVQTILEANKTLAAKEAQARGWSDSGHGDWYDSEGNLRGKTVNGRLQIFQGKAKKKPEEPATEKDEKGKELQIRKPVQGEGKFGTFSDGSPRRMPVPTKKDGTPKEDKGTITIAFGRFNPPHAGHQKVFDAAREAAGDGDLRIYPSRSEGKRTDPLDANTKHDYLTKMFPDHAPNIINDPKMRSIFNVLQKAYDDGYSSVKIVAGDKRIQEFDTLSQNYNGKGQYDFAGIGAINAGQRDEGKKGAVEGASASKLRKAAEEDRFHTTYYPKGHKKAGEIEHEGFEEYLPKSFRKDEKLARQLFDTVQKQLKGLKPKGKSNVKEGLWQIAPKLDPIGLRENYFKKIIFNIGDMVENLNHGLIGKITRRGTNHIIAVTEDNIMFKSWIKDLKEYTEKHMERRMRDKTHPNTLVGTGGYRKNTMAAIPGGLKKITNFKEQYPIINKLRQQYRSAKGNEGL